MEDKRVGLECVQGVAFWACFSTHFGIYSCLPMHEALRLRKVSYIVEFGAYQCLR